MVKMKNVKFKFTVIIQKVVNDFFLNMLAEIKNVVGKNIE